MKKVIPEKPTTTDAFDQHKIYINQDKYGNYQKLTCTPNALDQFFWATMKNSFQYAGQRGPGIFNTGQEALRTAINYDGEVYEFTSIKAMAEFLANHC
jgi:hypothetical protein